MGCSVVSTRYGYAYKINDLICQLQEAWLFNIESTSYGGFLSINYLDQIDDEPRRLIFFIQLETIANENKSIIKKN